MKSYNLFTYFRTRDHLRARLICIRLVFALITISLPFPFTTFASTRLLDTPSQPPEDITRAGVSVVRLLVSYTNQSGGTPVAECSGLGVLVASWPVQTPAENNNWILTDGKLVNTGTQATCVPGHPAAKFASAQINLSNEYNPQPISFTVKDTSIRCRDNPCDQGPVLIAFNLDAQHPEPHMDLAATNAANTGTFVGLTQNSDSFSMPTPYVTDTQQMTSYVPQIQNYRTPKGIPANGSPELGTPMVNQTGELVGVHLSSALLSAADIQSFMNTMTELSATHPANPVHDNWNKGMDAYYQKDFNTARTAFLAAAKANPEFQAASNYATLSASVPTTTSSGNRGTATSQSSNTAGKTPSGITPPGAVIPTWLLGVITLSILIGSLVLFWYTLVLLRMQRSKTIGLKNQSVFDNGIVNDAPAYPFQEPFRHQVYPSHSSAQSKLTQDGQIEIRSSTTLASSIHIPQKPPSPIYNPIVAESKEPPHNQPEASLIQAELLHHPLKEEILNHPVSKALLTNRAGERLGNYRLIRLLGHGGFADVYLGEHVFLKTQAAIKVLQTRLTKEALANFVLEARTIASLVHPHIVRVLEFGVEGKELDPDHSFLDTESSFPYLVMDYAPGGTLRKHYPKGTRLPFSTIIPYVEQIADALQYAHNRKVIHRDIKPENMLIGLNNEILLSDFGIAAVAHTERSMSTQEMAGTVPYIAPEQIRGKPRPASDQYALGVVVYEWLCGNHPFQGSHWEIIGQHLSTPPMPLRAKVPSIPPEVEAVVLKALSKDPLQRFETVKTFASALEGAF